MGLEVHVELNTATKMSCGRLTGFGAEPNTRPARSASASPALPVVNVKAVESAIRIGLVLNCRDRGVVPVRAEELLLPGHAQELPDLAVRRADRVRRPPRRRARRRHGLPGRDRASAHGGGHRQVAARRRLHRPHPRRDAQPRRLQPRRHPPHRDRHEADDRGGGAGGRAPTSRLRDLLKALDVSDVRMEQGSMRCDVNLSLMPKGASVFGTRSETKNVNRCARWSGRCATRWAPRGGPVLRRHRRAGDPALARGHRGHDLGPGEVGRRRLPLLPRARPRAGRAVARERRRAAGHAARAAGRAPQAAAPRGGSPTSRCATSSTPGSSSSSRRPSPRRLAGAARKWWSG